MELSALQSMVAVQEEELQVQAADMESLTRNIQIKEDLIKVFQSFLKIIENDYSSEYLWVIFKHLYILSPLASPYFLDVLSDWAF